MLYLLAILSACAAHGQAWIPAGNVRSPTAGVALFNPGPVSPWLAAMDGLSGFDGSWSGLSGLGKNSVRPEALSAASPLAQELQTLPNADRLRRDLEDPDDLRNGARKRLAASLEAARGRAAAKVEAEAARLLEELRGAREPALDDAPALRLRITELEALRAQLDALIAAGIYGRGGALMEAREEAGRRSAALKGAWLALELDAEAEKLKAFIDGFDGDSLEARPELFFAKMSKAAGGDFAFYRAFPQLQYLLLRESPGGKALGETPRVRVAGDFHVENIELAPEPQVNDFDESTLAPAGPEIVRALAGAYLLGNGDEARRQALLKEARSAYAAAIDMKFKDWSAAAAKENAVAAAEPTYRHWPGNGRVKMDDLVKARQLTVAAGLDPAKWTDVFVRDGAGLSSIGLLRRLFMSSGSKHVYEAKELRGSALEFFTGVPPAETDDRRVDLGWTNLRRVPVKHWTFSWDGRRWLMRQREPKETRLNFLAHPKSAARVIGGLAAQVHRMSDAGDLKRALLAVPEELVAESARAMARMRQALIDLLNRQAWGPAPTPS